MNAVCRLLLASLIALLGARAQAASDGQVILLPLGRTPAVHGLRLKVDSQWLPGYGYRPYRIHALPTTPGPIAADRTLRIEVRLGYRYNTAYDRTTVGYLELPEGSTGGSTTLLVPEWLLDSPRQQITVYENGVQLTELCSDTNPGQAGLSEEPNVLLVQGSSPNGSVRMSVPGVSSLDMLLADLSPEWLAYSSLDVIYISSSNLELLASEDRERFEALRRFVHAGGALFVGNASGTREAERKLEQLMGTLAPAASRSQSSFPVAADGNRPRLLTRPFGLGRVVLVPFDLQSDLTNANVGALRRALADNDLLWTARHGFDPVNGANEFYNFLIPGVGLAPVGGFVALISIFVVVIGPVNYGLLRRWQRLYLFPVTVSLGAALVTLGLFGYALVSDGLGVRVRVRSLTALDQRTHQASTVARQTYYAGLAPSGGLSFPGDTAVYPMLPSSRNGSENKRQELLWLDGSQKLKSGYFSSRTTAQFLTVSSRASELSLTISAGVNSETPPTVTNNLGGPLVSLSLCDAEGRYYTTEQLAEGESQVLTPANGQGVSTGLQAEIKSEQLAASLFEPSDFYGYRRGRMMSKRMSTPRYSESSVPGNILERRFTQWSQPNAKLAPRTYVAVVQRCPEVSLGHSWAREEASLHVIEGSW